MLQSPFKSDGKLATKNVTQNVASENGKKNSSHCTYLDSQRRVQCSMKPGHGGKSSSEDGSWFAWLQRPVRRERARAQQKRPNQQLGQRTTGEMAPLKSPPNFHLLLQKKPEAFPQNRFKYLYLVLFELPDQDITSLATIKDGDPNPL